MTSHKSNSSNHRQLDYLFDILFGLTTKKPPNTILLAICETFSIFLPREIALFWFRFHWDLFPMVRLTTYQYWRTYWLTPNGLQAITWTTNGQIIDAYVRHRSRWVKASYITGLFVHCNDVIMGAMVSQITSLTIVYLTIYSGANQRKHQSSASQAFVRGIHRSPVNSTHKWPATRKMFQFDDVIATKTYPG